jgi:DNA-binding transcriptional regulator GbsR (MarR family)
MHQSLQDTRDSVIRGLGQLTDFFGFSPVMGHLYGALLMSPVPLSLDALEEIVAKSKASVSMNMQGLERWGMVHEVWVKGDRRKFYAAESDLWKIVLNILESRERREVGLALSVLEDSAQQLEAAVPDMQDTERELAEYYLKQLRNLKIFFSFAKLLLEMLLTRERPPSAAELSTVAMPEKPAARNSEN